MLGEEGKQRIRVLLEASLAEALPDATVSRAPDDRDAYVVQLPNGTLTLGLSNIERQAQDCGPERWPGLVDWFVGLAVKGIAQAPIRSWDEARPDLRMMVRTCDGLLGDALPSLIYRRLAPGLVSVLALDLPETIVCVTHEQFDHWEHPVEMVMDVALAATLSERSPVDKDFLVKGVRWHEVSGGYWSASQLLGLRSPVLAIVPKRDLLAYVELTHPAVLVAIPVLLAIAVKAFEDGPYGVQPHVYWCHDGQIAQLSQGTSVGVSISVPDDLRRSLGVHE